MAIDLTDEKIFAENHEVITAYLTARTNAYFDSQCYKTLESRYKTLRDSIDMITPDKKNNQFFSKIAWSLTRKRYLTNRALIKQNFRIDPLFVLNPTGDTTEEIATTMQDRLQKNVSKTEFRQKAFETTVDNVARYGVGVVFSHYVDEGKKKKTVATGDPATPYAQQHVSGEMMIKNAVVHPLRYFQDAECSDPDDSYIRGFIDTWRVSELIACKNNEADNYIAENLDKVVKDGKESGYIDKNKYSDTTAGKDNQHLTCDVTRVWCTVNIAGNEDDQTVYYAEIVNGTIIRFQDNPLDDDIVPITCFRIRRRTEYWWGNTPVEDVISHENFYNLLMSVKADNLMRMADHINFFPRSWNVDEDDLKMRHENGGWVGYDIQPGREISRDIFTFSPQDTSTGNADWLVRELKENEQDQTATPDLSRGQSSGGPANKTAYAASILQSGADLLNNDLLELFSYDLLTMAKKNTRMIQQYENPKFYMRKDKKSAPVEHDKHQILGDFEFEITSSLQKNDLTEFGRWQNFISGLITLFGGLANLPPEVNKEKLIQEYCKWGRVGDVDAIYKAAPAPEAPTGAQSAGGGGLLPPNAPQGVQAALAAVMGMGKGGVQVPQGNTPPQTQ